MAHAELLLADELPLDTFEHNLMSFVEGLLVAQPLPLYTQLERGEVDGLSRKDSRSLRDMIGLD